MDVKCYDPVSTTVPEHSSRTKQEKGQLYRQYILGAIINISIVGTGFAMGWTSPLSSKLTVPNSPDNPLGEHLTSDDFALIGSLFNCGAICGPLVSGFLVSKIGRKWALLAASLPFIVGWILILLALNFWMLVTARIFLGFATGMIFTITPMYCSEIATDEGRGALGSFLQLFITFGFLLVYCVGAFFNYYVTAVFGLGLLVAFDVLLFFFVPESPFYYLSKNERVKAAESLSKIRGKSLAGVQTELDVMSEDVAASLSITSSYFDLLKLENFKVLMIASALVIFQQTSGINAVLFYMGDIFLAAGTKLSSDYATIIIGLVQFGVSIFTPFVASMFGRKSLLIYSGTFTGLGMATLGWFFYLQKIDSPLRHTLSFVPILSLIVFIIAYCTGVGALAWVVLGELFSMEIKAKAATVATMACWITCYFVTRYFKTLGDIGAYIPCWIFGSSGALLAVFTVFFVPETKGKSFQKIQDMLRTKKSSRSVHP